MRTLSPAISCKQPYLTFLEGSQGGTIMRLNGSRGVMPARPWLVAAGLAVSIVVGASGTASAYQVLSETGVVGPYQYSDTSIAPNAICGYERVSDEFEYLRWMKVVAPQVWAADRNADKRDSRIVSWRFELQKDVGPGFSTVAKSPFVKARAYEDQPAAFGPVKVFHNANAIDDGYVAQVTIRWHKNDRSIEGRVKLRLQFYGNKQHPGTVHDGSCPGGVQYF